MDINGGVYPNANGSPIWPASTFTGPLAVSYTHLTLPTIYSV